MGRKQHILVSGKIMINYLQQCYTVCTSDYINKFCDVFYQCFPPIFNNSFEPQSFNYDPEMFYSLNTWLSHSFALTSSG